MSWIEETQTYPLVPKSQESEALQQESRKGVGGLVDVLQKMAQVDKV